MDLDTRLRRFEQQLAAFEKLHAHELKEFEERLAAYVRIQADEVRQLRRELDELRALVRQHAAPVDPPGNGTVPPDQNDEEVSR